MAMRKINWPADPFAGRNERSARNVQALATTKGIQSNMLHRHDGSAQTHLLRCARDDA